MTGADRHRIAIVGIASRLPNASGPAEFWRLLSEGRDAIRDRAPERPYGPDRGGFVDGIEEFDAEFFRMSPKEAAETDPQQRLALELAWQGLEDARIAPGPYEATDREEFAPREEAGDWEVAADRAGRIGVFLGVMAADYADLVARGDSRDISRHTLTGTGRAMIANRISHTLGLHGPSMTVDTGQSSSLVAVHLACESLRRGEADTALAGGVHLIVSPLSTAVVEAAGALSPDATSYVFDERANGYVRGEGGGLVVLKPYDRALADGDRVYAVIEGSALGTGTGEGSLTVPSAAAQARTAGEALSRAGLDATQVQYVELHGTGTRVGDPIEAAALGEAYAQAAGRTAPLVVGSVKTNIGHLEGAAGIAGLIKTALCVHHRTLVPSLNHVRPNPDIPLADLGLRVATATEPWPATETPRIAAGVTSLGIGGTCCHVVLTGVPDAEPSLGELPVVPAVPAVPAVPVVLSAKSVPALRAQAERLRAHLAERPESGLLDVGYSAATTRAQLEHRGVVVARDRDELITGLTALAAGEPGLIQGRPVSGKTAFLFTGQGAQRAGMGLELAAAYPVFAAALDEVCAELDPLLGRSLRKLLAAEDTTLNATEYTQTSLFAIEVALFRLVESLGIRADYLIGHSVGEIAAAHVAGVLSLADACALVAARGRLMGALPAGGGMAAIQAEEPEVSEALAGFEGRLEIAAVNGPRSIVVSGDLDALDAWLPRWEELGRKTTRLRVSHAFHSPRMEPMLDEFRTVAEGLTFNPPRIAVVSNVTGDVVTDELTDPGYWVQHVRGAVRYHDGIRTLHREGVTRYLELGPDTILTALTRQCLEDEDSLVLTPALRARQSETHTFATFLGHAHTAGIPVDWNTYYANTGATRTDLPTYAFQRDRFRLARTSGAGDLTAAGLGQVDHPVLAACTQVGDRDEWLFTGRISGESLPWLADHVIVGEALVPGAAFLELVLAAGREAGSSTVEELVLQTPLTLPADASGTQVRVTLGAPDEDGRREAAVYSGSRSETVCHARGVLGGPAVSGPDWDAAEWPPAGTEPIAATDLYESLGDAGYEYGPAFQGVRAAWRDERYVYTELALSEDAADTRFVMHPALLDAALHGGLTNHRSGVTAPEMPFTWCGFTVRPGSAAPARVRIEAQAESTLRIDLADADGQACATAQRVVLKAAPRRSATDSLYRVEWVPAAGAAVAAAPARTELLGHTYADLAALATAVTSGLDLPELVVAEVAPQSTPHETTLWALALLRDWLAADAFGDARLIVATRNGIAAAEGEAPALAQAPIWGLVRSAQSEHPDRFLLVDLEDDTDTTTLDWAALAGLDEPQLALRAGGTLAPRLTRADAAVPTPAPVLDPEGTVLVTGGTGGLGALFAKHYAEAYGAKHLLLVSRRGTAAEGVTELVAELTGLGAQVDVAACDVTDRDALAQLITSLERPLTAVVHAAGILDDATIETLTPDQLARVLGPKAEAALHLDELTADLDLASFVLFSSVAALIGSPGQGNYAAANATLDALAARRQAAGLPATSLAWGLWTEAGGMGGTLDEAELARLERAGMGGLSAEQGLELYDAALRLDSAVLVPVRLEQSALRDQARSGLLPALLRGLVRIPARRTQTTDGSLAQRLAETAEADRPRLVLELVRAQAAAALGHASAETVDPGRAFKDLGLDSLGAVELRNRLTQASGVRLPSTLVFDHPTPQAVAEFLLAEAGGADPVQTRPAVRAARKPVDDEPLAIVGMSCRYPGGVTSPEELWQLLAEGRDAISPLPDDRGWGENLYDADPEKAGKIYTRGGGFLEGVGGFDAGFFGISPREALAMDPQQRLMLEAAWEAFEASGIDPVSLRGSETGVFCGVMAMGDYGGGAGAAQPEVEGFRLAGSTTSVLSGRVSYALGLEGPAVSIDTACSSSLVAMHLAAQALRSGECSLALAGGVTVMSGAFLLTEFSRQQGLAEDGRCKPYSAAADGTSFSDGLGLLVLERLSDARRNGHRVLGVLRGSAINQDGASNGLTAPNGPSQERVIRQALANARLSAGEVDAVEGHGTGTRLGDPIEAQALLATYGQERENGPLRLGSIKSNIGHTAAAAGVAGVIKMLKAMQYATLPGTLHLDAPSPHVDWSTGEVRLLAEAEPWPAAEGRPRRAGVSSFGISGTNAHVIIEEAPAAFAKTTERTGEELPAVPVVVSAKSVPALRAQAERLRAHVAERPESGLLDVGYSAATTRAQLEHRGVVVAGDRDELIAGLTALAAGEPGLIQGRPVSGKTAFLFTGQGAQRAGMGLELAAAYPVFAAALDEVCAELDPLLGRSLRELLAAEDATLNATEYTQTSLFAIEVALFRLVESLGIRADYLIGHSVGEIAAAHVAGVLSLADACALVAARGRLMGALPAGGGMAAIQAEEPEVAEALAGFEGRLEIAAVNGPRSIVVSGDLDALDAWLPRWEELGRKTTRLRVSHAFHSPRMEPMLDEFRKIAEDLTFNPPRIAVVSNVTGDVVTDELTDPGYWVQHVRGAVRYHDGIRTLHREGVTRYLELGPDAILTALTRQCLEDEDSLVLTPALRARQSEAHTFATFLGHAHTAGIPVDWNTYYANTGATRTDLPTYAFQHEHYWLGSGSGTGDVSSAGLDSFGHPVLAAAVQVGTADSWLFSGRISRESQPWIEDHVVLGALIVPGAALVELALSAGRHTGTPVLEELVLEAPLVLDTDSTTRQLQVTVGEPEEDGHRQVALYSRSGSGSGSGSGSEAVCHARGRLTAEAATPVRELPAAWPPAGAVPVSVDTLYAELADAGYEYGPLFQGVQTAWRTDDAVHAEIALPEGTPVEGFAIHPALLDAALHGGLEWLDGGSGDSAAALPFAWSGISLTQTAGTRIRVRIAPVGENALRIDLADTDGTPLATVDTLTFRPVARAQLGAAAGRDAGHESLFQVEWVPVALPEAAAPLRVERIGGDAYADLAALADAVAHGVPVPELVVAEGVRAASAQETTEHALALLQGWLAAEAFADTRLIVATRNGIATAEGEAPALAQAPIWGLVRSAQSEHPDRILLIDLEDDTDTTTLDWPALASLDEPQLALRTGGTLAPRLSRAALAGTPADAAWRLGVAEKGSLEGLALVPSGADRPLDAHEVRIGVRAAGLNFRDVLIALGMYPGEAPLGSEAAGVILEVGSGVTDLAPGDRVMGLVLDSFGPMAIADRRRVAPMPAGFTFAQAAAVPLVYLTAYYGLVDLAGLRAGERLLVHAAAGGVGMAAVQLAHHLGAEVFATASTPKWDAVRALGIPDDHIANSRDLTFREHILTTTNGNGVDVVLDALAGEFVDATLDLLPHGGRFIEMGKADIRDPEVIAKQWPGVHYRSYDLFEAGPDRIQEMLQEIVTLFTQGTLT
ncbi:SDR family NAD(P)-dependent oxidoreductase, partial [Streptomyces sp. NPDC058092]|uniref:SDR family NAD(P)-dependent oxidoreductase n=1 Tax=Streptomyces sp. NPDC058092 TaxID=3346336 RepID=UPI0036EB223E